MCIILNKIGLKRSLNFNKNLLSLESFLKELFYNCRSTLQQQPERQPEGTHMILLQKFYGYITPFTNPRG